MPATSPIAATVVPALRAAAKDFDEAGALYWHTDDWEATAPKLAPKLLDAAEKIDGALADIPKGRAPGLVGPVQRLSESARELAGDFKAGKATDPDEFGDEFLDASSDNIGRLATALERIAAKG